MDLTNQNERIAYRWKCINSKQGHKYYSIIPELAEFNKFKFIFKEYYRKSVELRKALESDYKKTVSEDEFSYSGLWDWSNKKQNREYISQFLDTFFEKQKRVSYLLWSPVKTQALVTNLTFYMLCELFDSHF